MSRKQDADHATINPEPRCQMAANARWYRWHILLVGQKSDHLADVHRSSRRSSLMELMTAKSTSYTGAAASRSCRPAVFLATWIPYVSRVMRRTRQDEF